MLHKLFAGALAALLLSVAVPLSSPSAQTKDTTDGTVPAYLTGRAAGAWDLPAGRDGGRVRGRLFDVGGTRFVLDAHLTPVPMLADMSGGRIDGVLFPVTSTGRAPLPIAEVHGTYLVGLEGRGQFEAAIVGLNPITNVRPDLLGKIAGVFADPDMRTVNPIGRFLGRWAISR